MFNTRTEARTAFDAAVFKIDIHLRTMYAANNALWKSDHVKSLIDQINASVKRLKSIDRSYDLERRDDVSRVIRASQNEN